MTSQGVDLRCHARSRVPVGSMIWSSCRGSSTAAHPLAPDPLERDESGVAAHRQGFGSRCSRWVRAWRVRLVFSLVRLLRHVSRQPGRPLGGRVSQLEACSMTVSDGFPPMPARPRPTRPTPRSGSLRRCPPDGLHEEVRRHPASGGSRSRRGPGQAWSRRFLSLLGLAASCAIARFLNAPRRRRRARRPAGRWRSDRGQTAPRSGAARLWPRSTRTRGRSRASP